MTYGSESECAIHYTTANHNGPVTILFNSSPCVQPAEPRPLNQYSYIIAQSTRSDARKCHLRKLCSVISLLGIIFFQNHQTFATSSEIRAKSTDRITSKRSKTGKKCHPRHSWSQSVNNCNFGKGLKLHILVEQRRSPLKQLKAISGCLWPS